ncbi:hypothetical protein DIPPA_13845 [Diplonema papillatum]|nr:hypothetical protein DIPPA_13845 [Diplonema papillatum]
MGPVSRSPALLAKYMRLQVPTPSLPKEGWPSVQRSGVSWSRTEEKDWSEFAVETKKKRFAQAPGKASAAGRRARGAGRPAAADDDRVLRRMPLANYSAEGVPLPFRSVRDVPRDEDVVLEMPTPQTLLAHASSRRRSAARALAAVLAKATASRSSHPSLASGPEARPPFASASTLHFVELLPSAEQSTPGPAGYTWLTFDLRTEGVLRQRDLEDALLRLLALKPVSFGGMMGLPEEAARLFSLRPGAAGVRVVTADTARLVAGCAGSPDDPPCSASARVSLGWAPPLAPRGDHAGPLQAFAEAVVAEAIAGSTGGDDATSGTRRVSAARTRRLLAARSAGVAGAALSAGPHTPGLRFEATVLLPLKPDLPHTHPPGPGVPTPSAQVAGAAGLREAGGGIDDLLARRRDGGVLHLFSTEQTKYWVRGVESWAFRYAGGGGCGDGDRRRDEGESEEELDSLRGETAVFSDADAAQVLARLVAHEVVTLGDRELGEFLRRNRDPAAWTKEQLAPLCDGHAARLGRVAVACCFAADFDAKEALRALKEQGWHATVAKHTVAALWNRTAAWRASQSGLHGSPLTPRVGDLVFDTRVGRLTVATEALVERTDFLESSVIYVPSFGASGDDGEDADYQIPVPYLEFIRAELANLGLPLPYPLPRSKAPADFPVRVFHRRLFLDAHSLEWAILPPGGVSLSLPDRAGVPLPQRAVTSITNSASSLGTLLLTFHMPATADISTYLGTLLR